MKTKPRRQWVQPKKDQLPRLLCIYLNLDSVAIEFDERGLDVRTVTTVEEAQVLLAGHEPGKCCLILGLSRNLMNNYLSIASLFFNDSRAQLPVILVTHASHKISDGNAFLFGRKPYPFKRLDLEAVQNLIELKSYNPRQFTRIPVEFVAFADPGAGGEQMPVVCKNISWGGTYFETREELKFSDFTLVLRSRLHTVEIPSRILRCQFMPAPPPPRYCYGVQFRMPLPLSLVHYMYAKYLKDLGGTQASEEGS